MKGNLYRSVLNEVTLEMGPEDQVPERVELVTQKKEFYGLVVIAGELAMLSPTISIGETEILLSGSVFPKGDCETLVVSSNYGVYQDWRFAPRGP